MMEELGITPETESIYEDLLAQGYDEETIAAILSLSGLSGQTQDIQQQQEFINQLRNSAGPTGRTAGNVYMAANPLEHVGHGLKSGIAEFQTARNRRETQRLRAEQERIRGDFLKRAGGKSPSSAPGEIPSAFRDPNALRRMT